MDVAPAVVVPVEDTRMSKYMREAFKDKYRKNVIRAAEMVLNDGANLFDIGTLMGYEGSDLEDFMEEALEYFVDIAEENEKNRIE